MSSLVVVSCDIFLPYSACLRCPLAAEDSPYESSQQSCLKTSYQNDDDIEEGHVLEPRICDPVTPEDRSRC